MKYVGTSPVRRSHDDRPRPRPHWLCRQRHRRRTGPRPGIAAQVEDAEVTLDDLTSVVDGGCAALQAARGERAAPTSRGVRTGPDPAGVWSPPWCDAEWASEDEGERSSACGAGPRGPRAGRGRVEDDGRRGRPRAPCGPTSTRSSTQSGAVRQAVPDETPDTGRLRHRDQPPVRRQAPRKQVRARRRGSSRCPWSDEAGTGEIEAPTPEALEGPSRRRAVREASRPAAGGPSRWG